VRVAIQTDTMMNTQVLGVFNRILVNLCLSVSDFAYKAKLVLTSHSTIDENICRSHYTLLSVPREAD